MTENIDQTKIKGFDHKTFVRLKPGFYFPFSGSKSIPCMLRYIIEAIVETSPDTYKGPIQVEVNSGTISVLFAGLAPSLFPPSELAKWFAQKDKWRWEICCCSYAADHFTLESCDGSQLARHESRDDAPLSQTVSTSSSAPFLRIIFHPFEPVFGTLTVEDLYNVAGHLRNLSFLQAGLATILRADLLSHELRHYYQDGMASLLLEEDYYHHPLHPGCLSFKVTEKDMSVEGHIRLIGRGPPQVRSYVNFQPSQGGTHLEGFGLALADLFPNPSRRCHEMTLYTNPSSRAKVILVHSLIGVLHIRLREPRYYGASKDVLFNPEARDFVHRAASATLKEQWKPFDRWADLRS